MRALPPRPALACGVALLALATVGLAVQVLVPRVGDAMARRALALTPAAPVAGELVTTETTDLGPPAPEAAERTDGGSLDGGAGGAGRGRSPEALDIPADRVARLTAKQLRRISATDAVDVGGHAQGARLHGVGGLGVGLADGDVVTSIDGRATVNADDATAAAIGAYASGEAVAHAVVLRDGRAVRVTVHIPKPDAGLRGAGPGDM